MIGQLKIQEQDVWEAWIEFDQLGDQFGTLYISGEIMASPGKFQHGTKVNETDYGRQLILQLPARPQGRSRIKEFFYSEPILNPVQYDSICVYAGDKLVARFGEIEILV